LKYYIRCPLSIYQVTQVFIIILALTFALNVLILIYCGVMLHIRIITQICEPVLLFVLRYNSRPNQVFVGSAYSGLGHEDNSQLVVVKHRDGDILIGGKKRRTQIELRGMGSLLPHDYVGEELHDATGLYVKARDAAICKSSTFTAMLSLVRGY
jgi:hypothetical protein